MEQNTIATSFVKQRPNPKYFISFLLLRNQRSQGKEPWNECREGSILDVVHLANIATSFKIIRSVSKCAARGGIGVVVVIL